MIIGYARVSTAEQNITLQINALKKTGCERIFQDKVSGSKDFREGLNQALEMLTPGDTFVVCKLDRLGLTLKNLITFIIKLEEKEVEFKSIIDSVDTSTASGKFFFHIMRSLAQMQSELISERTRAGLEVAKKKGKLVGRKRVMTDTKIKSAKRLLKAGELPTDVAKELDISLATLYRSIPACGGYKNK